MGQNSSVSSFKNRLDKHWASQELTAVDTIGKLNYQEPGVEAELNIEFSEFTINNDYGT